MTIQTPLPPLSSRSAMLSAADDCGHADTLLYALLKMGEAMDERDGGAICAVVGFAMDHVRAAIETLTEGLDAETGATS